jgi:hypothetical protein
MAEAALPPKILVAKIDRSPGNCDTTPDVLKQLKAAGVQTLTANEPGLVQRRATAILPMNFRG